VTGVYLLIAKARRSITPGRKLCSTIGVCEQPYTSRAGALEVGNIALRAVHVGVIAVQAEADARALLVGWFTFTIRPKLAQRRPAVGPASTAETSTRSP
jgi:hypothetical protein